MDIILTTLRDNENIQGTFVQNTQLVCLTKTEMTVF